jgi:hypothetical protein
MPATDRITIKEFRESEGTEGNEADVATTRGRD